MPAAARKAAIPLVGPPYALPAKCIWQEGVSFIVTTLSKDSHSFAGGKIFAERRGAIYEVQGNAAFSIAPFVLSEPARRAGSAP
jgi:hypothetical protein